MADERPNIVLIVLDTVRAKNLSLYGYERRTDRRIAALGSDAIVFDHALAPSAWTVPSHASLFSGQLPSEHGTIGPDDTFDTEDTLPTWLSEHGYETYGVSNNPFVGERNGFESGFDRFDQLVPMPTTRRFERGMDALELARGERGVMSVFRRATEETPASRSLATILNLGWYKSTSLLSKYRRSKRLNSGGQETTSRLRLAVERSDEPFFLFANYMEAHAPYHAPETYVEEFYPEDVDVSPDNLELDPWGHMTGENVHSDEELRAARGLYDAAIAYLDDLVGEFLDYLDESGLLEETIVVITSDHGEAFGEDDRLDHNYLGRGVTDIPLIVHDPAVSGQGGRRIKMPASLCWLHNALRVRVEAEEPPTVDAWKPPENRAAVSQYLELHNKGLERRFGSDAIEPFRERLQLVCTDDYRYLWGDRETERLTRRSDETAVEIDPPLREELQEHLPLLDSASESEDARPLGNEELLRSLGYVE